MRTRHEAERGRTLLIPVISLIVPFATGCGSAPSGVAASGGDAGDGGSAIDGAAARDTGARGDGQAGAEEPQPRDGQGGDTLGEAGGVLPLGTVVVVPPDAGTCMGAAPGATCQSLSVTCFGATNTVDIATLEPPGGAAVRGTITEAAGGAGTGWSGVEGSTQDFITPYVKAGFRVVQLRWAETWQDGTLGNIRSACWPATAYDWIYRNIQGADKTRAFCAQGVSGGSASIAYSLTQYGLGDELDYAMLESGPAVTRMDVGCALSEYKGGEPTLAMCPSIPDQSTRCRRSSTGWRIRPRAIATRCRAVRSLRTSPGGGRTAWSRKAPTTTIHGPT
jgi:hypothetical protein